MTIEEIQSALEKLGYKPGPIDGDLGRKTKAAVRVFQRRHGLTVDGIPGPKTQAALAKFVPGQVTPKPEPTPQPRKGSFADKVSFYMPRLMTELGLDAESAAAVFGNLGHESAGLKPAIKGPGQDYGWAQWIGPRKRAMFAFCKARGLDPASDEGNYLFVVHELKGTHRAAVGAVHRAGTLMEKVIRFERIYEVAGIKHYPSRCRYATMALAAYRAAHPN